MATTREEGAVPDFLRMDQPVISDTANARRTGNWHGWPTKDIRPVTLTDDEGRTVRIRTPVMDLEGLITPTDLHYTVQHFAVPPVVASDAWELKIVGQVKVPLTLNFDLFDNQNLLGSLVYFDVTQVPEPSSAALLLTGLVLWRLARSTGSPRR